jgi:endonuclease/exonuclease/phosphatase family metal-dependent hydrolase
MRVMTYNIRHGHGSDLDDPDAFGELDLGRIANVIRQVSPDIVALQEVDRLHPRSHRLDQPAALGDMLGMESCFGKNVDYKEGEYGVAILSRHPITSFTNTPLPTTDGWEVRGVLEATVSVPGAGDITVLNTHLQVGHVNTEAEAAKERGEQAAVIAGRLRELAEPVVLMGDFNAQPGDPELEPFAHLVDAWTAAGDGGPGFTIPAHPATRPEVRIDVIYLSDAFHVTSSRVVTDHPAGYASDHLPVVADVVVSPG